MGKAKFAKLSHTQLQTEQEEALMESTTRICQHCKEEIKAAAKKCRYCHSMQGGFRATLSNPAYTPFVGVAMAIPVMLIAFYFMRSSLDRNEKEFEKYRSLVVVQDSKIHYAKVFIRDARDAESWP